MHLLDANAFIEADRLYYGFDIAPGFWEWLGAVGRAGQVGSIAEVKTELGKGKGDLVRWVKTLPAAFWLPEDQAVLSAMTDLAAWATSSDRIFRQAAVNEFLDSADLRLVAQAKATGAIVVTREQPAPESQKKIKIPDACNAAGVQWTDPFQCYRELGLRLR